MKNIKKLMILLFVLMAFVATVQVSAAVSWPNFNSNKPIKTYTISTGNNTTAYSNANLNSKIGTIYASDELQIQSIGKNSAGTWYCKLTYPTSKGRKTGYVALSVVTKVTAPSAKYTAKAGITTYRRASSSATAGSIAKGDIVYKLTTSGSYVQVLYNTGSSSNPTGWKMAWITSSNFDKYINNTTTGYNPQGCVDSVTSTSAGKITVRGWAFDRDNLSSKLAIHVYVGGAAGSGAPCYGITANTSRPDVNNVFTGVGNYHGFDSTISVSKTGTQTVYIYAINVGAGTNVLIGTKTVTIKARSNDVGQYISTTELTHTANQYGIGVNTNAYKALQSINTKYASKLTAAQKKGINVFMFEGVGNNTSASKRMNAMCVVVKNGDIVYLNRNCSTIPDYPFNPAKNDNTAMPTLKSGIYTFSTVNHRSKYAALNVNGAEVVRFNSKTSYYSSTSSAINVHRRDSNSIASASASWVNSAGCLLVGNMGTESSSEYAKFIKALGIVGSNATGTSKYSKSITGKIIVDRTYAQSYLKSVGYSNSAIQLLGK